MKNIEAKEKIEKTEFKKKKSAIRILWNIITKVIAVVIMFISMIIIVQNVTKNQESFLGFRIFRVLTGSMVPKYQIGDVILVKQKDIDEIRIGEDVTYQGKEGNFKGVTVTHSVVDIEEKNGEKKFHTKGIANNLEDPVVSGEQILGVVKFKMPFLTLICTLLNNRYIFYFGAVIPLTIYIFFRVLKSNYQRKVERD